jgi:hypothetical protein
MTPEEIVRRHGGTDCTCLRDGFPCDACRMLMNDIAGAVAAEREACAKAVCLYCRQGWPLKGDEHHAPEAGHILLPGGRCNAAAIRARGRVTTVSPTHPGSASPHAPMEDA